jgi:enhancing lycopene biosynthesis protein 2
MKLHAEVFVGPGGNTARDTVYFDRVHTFDNGGTMKRIAVVLSGCGFKDGSEITESVSTLIALTEANCAYECFAPDIEISAVDHLTGKPDGLRRLINEAARIARSKIKPLSKLNVEDMDAVVFPGGYGAAVNLSTWAKEGSNCKVNDDVAKTLTEFNKAGKPIGAICISPVLVAKVLGSKGVSLTIGDDLETSQEIEKLGAKHVKCYVTSCVVDNKNKVVTTPAYMYDDAVPAQVFKGISKLVNELIKL